MDMISILLTTPTRSSKIGTDPGTDSLCIQLYIISSNYELVVGLYGGLDGGAGWCTATASEDGALIRYATDMTCAVSVFIPHQQHIKGNHFQSDEDLWVM